MIYSESLIAVVSNKKPSLALNCGRDLNVAQIEALARVLSSNNSLHTLDLSCSGLDGEKVSILARAIRGNNTLLRLDLQVNKIQAIGAAALAEAIRNIFTLTTLNLALNSIGTEGVKSIQKKSGFEVIKSDTG
jgi:Ran GTPase-activating protein (RanGAP) involved in mRNA processing and transport